jgi:D-sedoheptulose 7-phosphate isomerase
MKNEDMVDRKAYLERYLESTVRALQELPLDQIARVIEMFETARDEGRQIFICGNGGSAATASHLANDLGKGASIGRARRFRPLALTDNIPWITALANDLDYSQVFVEQLKNFGRPKDLLVAFSGSGNSPNVLEAVRWARREGLTAIGVTGKAGGALAALCDVAIHVPSDHMGRIEDGHCVIQHLIGYYLMENHPAQELP